MIKVPLRAALSSVRCFSTRELTEHGSDWARAAELTERASLYVHWPYCLRRCTYCNFNKYIAKENKDQLMTRCLQQETETLLQLSKVSSVTSVFFGGGTPSLAHPSTIAAVLQTISSRVHLSDEAEVTLEVNPTPAGKSKLEDYCSAGVNRFSIGLQSLQDEDLKVLGRDHSCDEALQTLDEARRLCPGRVSVDVMFGRPNQTLESWENELKELLEVCDDHVSLYQLTLERGTELFKQVQSGRVAVPGEDVTAAMYQCARTKLQLRGFLQYEVSNFARHDSVSLHNLSYWKGSQYIGVGPGAHGRFVPLGDGGAVREARTQTLEPDVWTREVLRRGHGTRRRIPLGRHELCLTNVNFIHEKCSFDRLEEVLVMGMRMTKGINHKHWKRFSPEMSLHQVFGGSADVKELLQSGQLILDDRGLRCSWDGLAILDSLLPTLLVELEKHVSPGPHRDHPDCRDGHTERTAGPR